jgi:hypothetical protein
MIETLAYFKVYKIINYNKNKVMLDAAKLHKISNLDANDNTVTHLDRYN